MRYLLPALAAVLAFPASGGGPDWHIEHSPHGSDAHGVCAAFWRPVHSSDHTTAAAAIRLDYANWRAGNAPTLAFGTLREDTTRWPSAATRGCPETLQRVSSFRCDGKVALTYRPEIPVSGSLGTTTTTKQTVAGVGPVVMFDGSAFPGLLIPPADAAEMRKARHLTLTFSHRVHDGGGTAHVEVDHVYHWTALQSAHGAVLECAKRFGTVSE